MSEVTAVPAAPAAPAAPAPAPPSVPPVAAKPPYLLIGFTLAALVLAWYLFARQKRETKPVVQVD